MGVLSGADAFSLLCRERADFLRSQLQKAQDLLTSHQSERDALKARKAASPSDEEVQIIQDVLEQLDIKIDKLQHACQRTGDRLSYYDHLRWEPPVAES